ncbi:hypothetical protein QTP70_020336, partial [Hemibagrus guttatus]
VMAVDAWLWALGLMTGPVWVHSVGLVCTLQTRPISGSLYKEGHVIIGGLFPVHFGAPEPDQMFTQRVQEAHCQGADLRSYGWLQTMIFTVEEINRNSSLLPNFTLGYLAADTCLAESSTLSAALAMVTGQVEMVSGEQCTMAPNVPIIIGDARSSASIVVADTLGVFDIPMVSYFASCACLSDRAKYPTFLRTVPSDAFQAKAMARLLHLMGWTWVGVISGDDAYGKSGVQLLLQELQGSGVCIDYLEIIPKSFAPNRMRRIVERIQSSKALVVVTFAISPDMEILLKEVLLHYLKAVKFTTPVGEQVHFDENGDPAASYDIINWHEGADGKVEFLQVGHFDAVKGPERDFQLDLGKVFWGGGWGGMVPVSVCSESCPPGTRKAVQKGRPVCCYDCIPCASGEISNATDSTECTKCPERFWSNTERTECIPMIVEFLSFQDNMGIILSVLSAAGAALTITVLAAFFHHRDTPLVRANNSELSFLLLLSLSLCFLCALAFIGRPAPWSCMLRHTLFGISFVVCLACVLSKTVVVLVAFRATLPGSNVMRYFGPVQQRAGIFLCTLIQVGICVLWLVLAPPLPTESAGGELGARVVLLCAVGSVAGFSLVLGYIGLLAAICFLLAFFARKLPDNFNEAKFITFSMLIFCAVWITFVPAYVSSPGKYTVAVEVFAILASSYGLLLCIFAPKCYIILLRPDKNTKKNMMAK